jgi:hypothetical protein
MRVFEYGAGGSTLFWAKRVREVVSIEHDRMWGERVQATLSHQGLRNCHVRLIEPVEEPDASRGSPADPADYVSADTNFRGFSFRNYARSIDDYPDGAFDLIIVDGRARPSCGTHALPKVKTGGFLLLDNAERDYYAAIHQKLESLGWQRHSFFGPGPYNLYFWLTTVWRNVA